MNVRRFLEEYGWACVLGAILLVSAFLNLWNIASQGFTNTFYAAAVRSILENPHLLFFNSYDPAGFVTVDKPPVGLWVQALSAVIFGYSGWALVLPQALAGTGSVFLVYCIVSRPFGKAAGLVGAFALAVTPIFVAVSRNGTMDSQLIFVLLLALWAGLKAARERSLPWLLCSAVIVGIGFNIKMIQAFIVVPAILAVYLLGSEIPVKKRAVHIFLAVGVLLAVSLSWAVAVDMVPAKDRPYIGGSGDNTVTGLIVNYNGLHRLEGGDGSSGPGSGFEPVAPGNRSYTPGAPPGFFDGHGMQPGETGLPPAGGITPGSTGPGQMPGAGSFGNGPTGDTGIPGILRLAGENLAGQLSWLIPFALLGLIVWWRWPLVLTGGAAVFSERGLCMLAFVLWLVPGLAYFSFTTGFWHPYYLATIAPALAAVVGIGTVLMYNAYRSDSGWRGWLLIFAMGATGVFEAIILSYTPSWSGWLATGILGGTLGAVFVLILLRFCRDRIPNHSVVIAVIGAIALLFVAPCLWATTPLSGTGGTLPLAGPHQGNAPGNPGIGGLGDQNLEEYLRAHFTNETWALAVPSSMAGDRIIIDTGMPVMAIGGFSGNDEILSVTSLGSLVKTDKVRFFLVPASQENPGSESGNNAIYAWVDSHCTAVTATAWGGSDTNATTAMQLPFAGGGMPWGSGSSLYDCLGVTG